MGSVKRYMMQFVHLPPILVLLYMLYKVELAELDTVVSTFASSGLETLSQLLYMTDETREVRNIQVK